MHRSDHHPPRAMGPGIPAALAGSIALTMLATPAHAADAAVGHTAAVRFATADTPTETVRPGDTVTAIAARHGLRTADVLSWNGLTWSSIIRPGQVLVLSATTPAAPPAAALSPPPPPVAPAVSGYTVVAGDTMSAIARRHGVSTDALLAANALSRSSIIYPGQSIAIPGAVAASSPVVPAASATGTVLDSEQTTNARTIIRVGRSVGASDPAIAIALATAMQESSLRNLADGPDDSAGLFQQRPSTGWGTDADVRDPERATRAFFGGPTDPDGTRTRGLFDIVGWESLGLARAAQAVQVSAYPDRYAAWEASAYTWLAALG